MSAMNHRPITYFRSKSAAQTRAFVSERLAPHRMTVNGDAMNADFRFVEIGDALIADIHYGADVDIEPLNLNDCYLIHALISGCSTLRHDGEMAQATTGTLHISSPGTTPHIHLTSASRHLTVRLPAAIVRRYVLEAHGIAISHPIEFDPISPATSSLPALWRDYLGHIVRQFELAPDLMQNLNTQRCYTTLMCELLFSHQVHSLDYSQRKTMSSATPRHVHKAKAVIRERFRDPLSTALLASEVGVSVRSLHNGFRDFLDTTPAAYIRQFRIEKLHHKLINAKGRISVTEAMTEAGIVNFGRYAGYYTAKYGCNPSETLRRSTSPL
ncbi:hypothetical protein ASD39_18770 [Sphingomonas sp. Root50]|uniref:AraC family transcriptional regulator n=2 Tax=Sphingomonas TaxID=13687 RepID=UPI0006F4EF87|nr:AraC family transcriptional regulator [Sphingomonas sp. Root50]KQX18668.1 hypothetical protein ASD17_16205 [Sphingomonas sp. Root1294]KQY72009.1 hypothetical protein ASD39_18770 [Sphingomonas sp. Root50]KRB94723.1 hypothetical protein ASE22_01985 [Sphingomonas sp. Root720]